MTTDEGKSFLMDRYLDELKRMEEEHKKDSSNEVQSLKEQLSQLSAEMKNLRQALDFHQKHPMPSCSRSHHNHQDSGYSDNLADSFSASSSISLSSSSSTSSSSATYPGGSSSCSCSQRPAHMTPRMTSGTTMAAPGFRSDRLGRLDDLVRLPGPATDEAVCKALHQRWMCGECQTKLGPILVALNPHRGLSQDQVLSQAGQPSHHPHLVRLAQQVHEALAESRRPQAIILSGESGSGKTYTSQLFLRQLHSLCRRRPSCGGGKERSSDNQLQNLADAFHVLRALGCAKTRHNSSASRVGHHIEVQLTGNAITKTKFQCHWFDQSRVVNTPAGEENFKVFYQMLGGLTHQEQAKLHLHGYNANNLAYLKHRPCSDSMETSKERFNTLRNALSSLGIEFNDVMRILAAILLLGNVQFVEDGGYELDIKGSNEIKAVATLLGVSGVSLYRALTTRTHCLKGQAVKTLCNADMANDRRDTLAKALYCRMTLAVVKRINSVLKQSGKCPPYVAPSISSEDTQSSGDSCSRFSDSTCDTAGGTQSAEGSTHSEGTIHIIDMPGFANSQCNRLEDLCRNYTSEALQGVYLQHTFRGSREACREEEGVGLTPVPYLDNTPCLEFLVSKNGLFPIIDALVNKTDQATQDDLMVRLDKHHQSSSAFAAERENRHHFTVAHSSGEVRYSAGDFLDSSRDVIGDDVVGLFRRKACSFGFASHLFAPELKLIQGSAARGLLFRICPRPPAQSGSGKGQGSSGMGSLPLDCHVRLQDLMTSLGKQQAQMHFIQCIRVSDEGGVVPKFSHPSVARQVRSLQLTPALQGLSQACAHSQGLRGFLDRYHLLLTGRERHASYRDQCRAILDLIMRRCELIVSVSTKNKWLISQHTVFYSEETRQALESVRGGRCDTSARFLQSKVRCWLARRRWPPAPAPQLAPPPHSQLYEECIEYKPARITFKEPVYERISIPSTPDPSHSTLSSDTSSQSDGGSVEPKKARIQATSKHAPQVLPPPLPSNHPSSGKIDESKGFPQTRIMTCSYSPDASCEEPVLQAGEPILVMGVASSKDLLIVEHNSCTLHVPLKLTLSQTGDCILGTRL